MTAYRTIAALESAVTFADRHIGPNRDEQAKMLAHLGYSSLSDLVAVAVPATITTRTPMELPPAQTETEVLAELRELAGRNRVLTQMIGLGYYDTIVPPVILRNVLENPGWYTAYTPYQPEISQGRLEALLNFQTVVADLTALPTANASLLDEATAAAEAMTLAHRSNRKSKSNRFLVDADTFAQTIAVVRTRAGALGIEVVVADTTGGLPDGDFFGVLLQYPGSSGLVRDLEPLIEAAHEREALVAVASDLLALTLLTPPGENGADIVVGSSQRFGVPLFYGGSRTPTTSASRATRRPTRSRSAGSRRRSGSR